VSSLPDAERDAVEALRALAGLAALLRDPDLRADQPAGVLLTLAQDGEAAAARALAYLRDLRGNGDGDAAAVPPRLGPFRDWVPARGHLFGDRTRTARRADEVPNQPRRGDPGE
jgi:hypothetical protein